MSRQTDYMVGWIDTTIHDFLLKIDEPTSSMAYALITCLDSNFNIPSMLEHSKHLQSLKGKIEGQVGKGILLRSRHLLAAERDNRLFFGFDEVWFFPNS